MSSRHPLARILAVVVTALALMMTVVSMPASAASTGRVKGVVTVDGKPLDFAKVQLFRNIDSDPGGDGDDGKFRRLETVNTGKDGKYSFSGLKSKKDRKYGIETYRYVVVATDRSGKTVRSSQAVKVKKGRSVTKNFQLKPAGIVTGKISRSDGRSPQGLTVNAITDETVPDRGYNPQLLPNTTTEVRADGTFILSGLQPGDYESLTVGGGRYAAQWYDFTAGELTSTYDPAERLRFSVAAGQRLRIAPATVTELISKVSGTVTDTSGHPLKNITVRLTAPDGTISKNRTKTSSSGRFTFSRLKSGTHLVRFDDPKSVWAFQYADGAVRRADARVLKVVAGNDITDVNVDLKSRAKVKATLTGGKSTAKLVASITRKSSGGRPSGSLTVTVGDSTKTVRVVKGKAKASFAKLPRGRQSVTATYSGTRSTEGFTKTYSVKVK